MSVACLVKARHSHYLGQKGPDIFLRYLAADPVDIFEQVYGASGVPRSRRGYHGECAVFAPDFPAVLFLQNTHSALECARQRLPRERLELKDGTAREHGGINIKIRIFRSGSDERYPAVLDKFKQ